MLKFYYNMYFFISTFYLQFFYYNVKHKYADTDVYKKKSVAIDSCINIFFSTV